MGKRYVLGNTAIVLAAAAVIPFTAHAQSSNVTLYGRVNVSFESTKVEDGPNANQVVDNGSRFGLRGSEDLGGGLSAIFQMESRFRADSGGTGLATRDTWVGMRGNFGTVKIGRMYGPVYYATADWISMHNHDTGNSADAFYSVVASPYADGRNNNVVYYGTPTWGGFKVEAAYSLLTESANKPREFEVAASYDTAKLHAAVGFGETKGYDANSGAEAPGRRDRGIDAAISYDFGSFTLAALAERAKIELASGTSTRNYYRVAGMLPVGPHELHLNIGRAGSLSGTSSTGATQWTVGYNHILSKRTKLYAFYTRLDNEKSGSTGGGYSFLSGTSPGQDNSSLAIGLRHNF